jgi:SAM-dependent methyltransferase
MFLCDREGLSIDEVYRFLSPLKRLQKPYWSMVSLPKWLARLPAPQMPSLDFDTAKSLCRRRIRGLQRVVESCSRSLPRSLWTEYNEVRTYEPASLDEKRRFTDHALETLGKDSWVLDLGANTGEFSLAAAQKGFHVVAVDSDEACMDQLFSTVQDKGLDITPVVMNLGRPTPSCGWNLQEQPSFLERSSGRFDLVLALALGHHLRFCEGASLRRQAEIFWGLSRKNVLLEWVAPQDPMVQSLVKRFGYLPGDYTQENLEASLLGLFHVRSRLALKGGSRWLYLLEKQ